MLSIRSLKYATNQINAPPPSEGLHATIVSFGVKKQHAAAVVLEYIPTLGQQHAYGKG